MIYLGVALIALGSYCAGETGDHSFAALVIVGAVIVGTAYKEAQH